MTTPVRRWTTPLLFAAPACALALALTSCMSESTSSTPRSTRVTPPDEPVRLAGWNLQWPSASEQTADGPLPKDWSGAYRIGEPLWVPAGTRFVLQADPIDLEVNVLRKDSPWFENGGDLAFGPEGSHTWLLQAPITPGTYVINYRTGKVGPVPSSQNINTNGPGALRTPEGLIPVLVMARAEMKDRGDRTHVKVFDKNIGDYLEASKSSTDNVRENAWRYKAPKYFARLNAYNLNFPLAPGLAMSQMIAFMEKRDDEGHKVILPDRHTDVLPPCRALYDKLGKLRERLQQKGYKVTHFWITSGFRTPEYNKKIGGAAYSRHCFGDAVDLCIDEDGDLHMDDLNHDGKVDRQDGIIIAEACEELEKEGAVVPGGIGVYEWIGEDSVKSHVHIDCRGFPVRWGQGYTNGRKVNINWWGKLEPGLSDGAGD